jgi:hypothetical protein
MSQWRTIPTRWHEYWPSSLLMTDSEIRSRPRFEILPTKGAEEQAAHHYAVAGLHLYTFNQVKSTEQWRQRMLGPKNLSGKGVLR